VLAYSAARRTGEIAIRMSLGAMPRDIFRLLLTEGLRFATIGIAVGLAASYWLTRLLTSFLFNLSRFDGPTFSVSAFVLLAAAILACWIPARRATRVDPMTALRNE
jgi:ABC-type antimicrobial peptide transport system permease subunit